MTDDEQAARERMVDTQIAARGVGDPRVLAAMRAVPRHRFVPAALRGEAYSDHPLPIGHGSTISQPYIVAAMTEAARVEPGARVLEIGAGSGYFAALLAARVEWVRSIEIVPELVRFATENLKRNGVENVVVEEGDGALGWPNKAPYDLIVVSGGLPVLPHALLEQLRVGGRLFAFVGDAPLMSARLVTCTDEGEYRTEDLFETLVPQLKNAPPRDSFEF